MTRHTRALVATALTVSGLIAFGRGGTGVADSPGTVQALPRIAGAKPRNVVFILADDHRYDAMSFMGTPIVKTPNLDLIAQRGVHLKNAFVTTSLCSQPSDDPDGALRASTPRRGQQLPSAAGHRLLPAVSAKAGYQTALIGKWHMGERQWRSSARIRSLGQLQRTGLVPAVAGWSQRRWHGRSAKGLHHRRTDRLRTGLVERSRSIASVLSVPRRTKACTPSSYPQNGTKAHLPPRG